MPATTANQQQATSQSLIDLRGSLERLKAQRDMIEKEIEEDLVYIKHKWGINDIESALDSIRDIEADAQKAAETRDTAIASAEKILTLFKEQ